MKGHIMTWRSRYRGLVCPHCYRDIRVGQSFIGHTLHFEELSRSLDCCSRRSLAGEALKVQGSVPPGLDLVMRLAYHSGCLQAIVSKSPSSEDDVAQEWETYRAGLQRQHAREGADEDPPA